jgi:SAM-dependent methyltransferase
MTQQVQSAGHSRGIVQRAMESPLVVSIYESRLWRRSPFVEAAMGITFQGELDCVAQAGRIEKAKRVLDLACGSGIYTRPFARRARKARVIGLDISRPMLAHARRKSREEGLHNLDLVRGSALTLPFRSKSFDVVNCCAALHLLPDIEQTLSEIHRVLRPGGRFTTAVLRVRDDAFGQGQARFRRLLLDLHSFTRPDLGQMLEDAGFVGFEVLHERGVWMVAAASKRGKGRRGNSA